MIFNINFFLFCFAQSNIWSYTFVYAKHYANISNVEFGTLSMILPMLAFFIKPMACSISDAKGIHREVLIGSLTTFGLSYGSLGILPFIKDRNNSETDYICWIIMSIIMTIGYLSCACIFCMNDALASNYARKHNKAYSRMRIFASAGWSAGALLLMLVGEISWLPFQVFACIVLFIVTLLDVIILILWPYPEDFIMFHDGSTIEQRKLSIVGPKTINLLANMKPRGSITHDMLERIRTGRSKSVGFVDKIETIIIQKNNDEKQLGLLEEKKEYSNFQCQMTLIKLIAASHKSFIRYILLFTTFGIIYGMILTYQNDYFKAEITKTDEDFKFVSTLCMIAQSWAGEILISIIATDMLRIFGANANLSLALVSIGLRCYFYANITPYMGLYSVIMSEALHGPSAGLYNVLTVDIGSNYALMVTDFMPEMRRRGMIRDRQHEEELNGCSRATMIGIMSSSMEGLGVAIGALLGGYISTTIGYSSMWNIGAMIGLIAGFSNISWDLFRKLGVKDSYKKSSHVQIPTITIQNSNQLTDDGTKL